MKYSLILGSAVVTSLLLFSNCHTSKKTATTTTTAPAVSYSSNMKSLVEANCSPCHIPEKGGNKKPLDTYDNLKSNIDEVIHRIQLNPTDKGFMPNRRPKLSDSTIAVFVQWRDAGMPQ